MPFLSLKFTYARAFGGEAEAINGAHAPHQATL